MKLLDSLINLIKGNKTYVGVFVSPRSYIEVVKFDSETNTILKHGRIDLAYDAITRQVSDIKDLELNIIGLYDELDISLSTPSVLTLQTVFLGHSTLPMELDNSEIKSVLTDQIENNFLFRNHQPEICYERIAILEETNAAHLAYTAIQKEQLEQISEGLKRQGLNIVAVDTSYASLLRGLSVAGICSEDIDQDTSWSVLLVNNNSIILLSLVGNRLVEVSDIPIAVRSFQSNEVCSVVASYSMDAINEQSPDHLIIISKSDEVSAEELRGCYDLNCKITYLEENVFIKEPLFNFTDPEGKLVDLETIGSAFWGKTDIPLSFNFLKKDGGGVVEQGNEIKIGNFSFTLTPKLFQNILIGLLVFSLLLVVGACLICSSISSGMDKKFTDLSAQKSQLDSEIAAASTGNKLSADEIIDKVFEKNGKILQSYNALGSVIPQKLWIESFDMKDDFSASITGKSYSVDDIVAYYQNLIRSAYFQNLKISSIKVVNGDSTSSNNSGVSIVSQNNNQVGSSNSGSLPGIPSLPGITSQKYYEFSFGNTMGASASTSSAAPGTPAPASTGAPSPSPGMPGIPGMPMGSGR